LCKKKAPQNLRERKGERGRTSWEKEGGEKTADWDQTPATVDPAFVFKIRGGEGRMNTVIMGVFNVSDPKVIRGRVESEY